MILSNEKTRFQVFITALLAGCLLMLVMTHKPAKADLPGRNGKILLQI